MDDSYLEMKTILDKGYQNGVMAVQSVFLEVLKKYGMPVRGEGNKLLQVNYSIASSIEAIVIGLRYQKASDPDDLLHSEDHAVFVPNQPMRKCYGKQIEEVLPEYAGMHKRQINLE